MNVVDVEVRKRIHEVAVYEACRAVQADLSRSSNFKVSTSFRRTREAARAVKMATSRKWKLETRRASGGRAQ